MAKKVVEKVLVSPEFALTVEDLKRSAKNALKFIWPLVVVLLGELTKFIPDNIDPKYVALALWTLNWVADILYKFVGETRYVKEVK